MSDHRRTHTGGSRARRAAARITGLAATAWATHRRLLDTNPAYAATLAAVVAAIATQGDPADLIAALAAGALAIYSTLRHHPNEY